MSYILYLKLNKPAVCNEIWLIFTVCSIFMKMFTLSFFFYRFCFVLIFDLAMYLNSSFFFIKHSENYRMFSLFPNLCSIGIVKLAVVFIIYYTPKSFQVVGIFLFMCGNISTICVELQCIFGFFFIHSFYFRFHFISFLYLYIYATQIIFIPNNNKEIIGWFSVAFSIIQQPQKVDKG